MENMELWNRVCTTDATHTKPVEYGSRKFTAIDAYHQIRRATELFGPVGIGWGWDAEFTIADGICLCSLRMWYKSRENDFSTVGSAKVGNDGEAPKKALTDGITKGLSYLGFNADVFLGEFTDNKYVQTPKSSPVTVTTSAPAQLSPMPGSGSFEGNWRDVVIHFGKNQGKRLGDLAGNSLEWYATKWQPKPYNGQISQDDANLRAALDACASELSGATPSTHPTTPMEHDPNDQLTGIENIGF